MVEPLTIPPAAPSAPRRRLTRRRVVICLIASPFLLILLLVALVALHFVLSGGYYRAKYAGPSAPAPNRPIASPRPASVNLQLLDHTCGFLSLEAVYRAYGVSPEQTDLRFRLGVDQPAIPRFTSSRGTLHPDMFRVLAQDGFAFRMVDPQSPRAAVAVGDHLRRHVALALIVREETNGLHWIVIDRNGPASAPETFLVVDPLDPEPRTVTEGSLFTPRLVSLVLITPAEEPSAATLSELHAAGLREMARVRERAAAIDD